MSVCEGRCKGERSALDSPAKIVHVAGKTFVWCECHDGPLRVVGVQDVVPGRFVPELDTSGSLRFTDDACGYDYLMLRELKAKA